MLISAEKDSFFIMKNNLIYKKSPLCLTFQQNMTIKNLWKILNKITS